MVRHGGWHVEVDGPKARWELCHAGGVNNAESRRGRWGVSRLDVGGRHAASEERRRTAEAAHHNRCDAAAEAALGTQQGADRQCRGRRRGGR